ncbi:MAG: T9SS type A sorting domain-containing protein [Chryseobacterium sp.]|jgi:hypothetical protein|uniref:T9SS-dependent choice-of-anchor J family protein n=1 Tax=Chryseobacterium sp. TaxID=1871047 RepID=UPI00282B9389|nr:T9SS type A sorting domain-containing protein [Chryseobacterium sp.]MDR2237006.1 T9SS type A sorting domain-containing protein [Chryseobacterium sp.]
MKNTLFFLFMLSAQVQLNAQTVIFEETFDQIGDDQLPTGWVSEDRDGEGSRWLVVDNMPNMGAGMTGNFIATASINPSGDHLLITPDINLLPNNSYSLTYQIGIIGMTPDAPYPSENHFALYILPAADLFTGLETPILEETVNSSVASTNVHLRTVDLSAYAAQNVKIYFRQFNGPSSYGSLLMLDTVKITGQTALATSEINQEPVIGIYPNPASDYVHLKSKSKITKAEVYDMAGRKLNVKLDHERLDVKDLQPGTYIIATESENKKSTHKLIKK